MTALALYVAMADNGVIGRDNGLPWRLSSDLKRFKSGTMGKPIIMGRKTFESIGRPLPGRLNIVVTRNAQWQADGVLTATSLESAIALAEGEIAESPGADEICVIGGGEIYRQALPVADRLHVTHVKAEIDGDTRFPPIDPQIWKPVSAEDHPAGERDSHATRYVLYLRR